MVCEAVSERANPPGPDTDTAGGRPARESGDCDGQAAGDGAARIAAAATRDEGCDQEQRRRSEPRAGSIHGGSGAGNSPYR